MKKLLGLIVLTAAILSLTAFRRPFLKDSVAIDWTTEAIEKGAIAEKINAIGTIQPANLVQVGCDSAGRVVRVLVEPGQIVSANAPLAQLDDRMAQIRVQQAKLSVELAQAEVQRAEAGRDAAQLAVKRARDTSSQTNPPRDADAAELHLRASEAAVKAAQLKIREAQLGQQLAEHAVEMTNIRAPIAGVVLEKRITAGQQIGPPLSAHVFTIAPDLEHLQVIAHCAESDIGNLRNDMTAQFTVNAWPDQTFEGRVNRVAHLPLPVQGAVQYPVSIDVLNTKTLTDREWRLRAGMSAAVEIVISRHEHVWRLPIAALSVTFEETKLTDSARRKLARWKSRSDRSEYQRVWTLGADRTPTPLFLRTGGRDSHGEVGINDGRWVEVLAWDPDEPVPTKPVRVIIAIPDSMKPTKPGLKLF